MRMRGLAVAVLLTAPVPAAEAYTVSSTAYCLQGTMANGRGVHTGAVANNFLPLGTKVTVSRSPYGTRRFVVEDRIGWGTQLDFWVSSCSTAAAWGRQTVTLTVGWRRKKLVSRVVRVRRYAPLRGGFVFHAETRSRV